MEKIICPVCGSKKIRFIYSKNNHNIFKCDDCRLAFVNPIPDDLNFVYSKEYFVKDKNQSHNFGYINYDSDKQSMKETFNIYLQEVTKDIKKGSIFDIGAATGFFLDLAKNFGLETFGCEISPFAAELARQRGHEVATGKFNDLEIDNKFSIITAWDVLEHLPDPKAALHKINKLLDLNGILAINTVDIESWWAKLMGKRWHLLVPPEHLFYFSLASLSLMFKEAGFEIVKIKKITKKFSLAYILNTLFNLSGITLLGKLADKFNSSFWRKMMIPINLRDNIFIIVKKTKDI